MAQASEKITFTAPAELVAQINEAAESEGCSRSEFLRQAVTRYMLQHEFQELRRYGVKRAKELGIRPEDVDDLIHEYRAEVEASEA